MFKFTELFSRLLLILLYFLFIFKTMAEFYKESSVSLSVLYMICLYIFWTMFEAFQIEQRRFLDLVYAQLFSSLCTGFFFLVLLYAVTTVPVFELAFTLFGIAVVEAVAGIIWVRIFFDWYLKEQGIKKALYLYAPGEDIIRTERLTGKKYGYFQIVQSLPYTKYKDGTAELAQDLEKYQAVLLGEIPEYLRNQILTFCMHRCLECYCIPRISDLCLRSTAILRMYDMVLLRYPSGTLSREQQQIKRVFDVIISVFLLLACLPLMALIAVCVKLEDGGSILYRQDRVTLNGRTFQMLKFRSMQTDAEKFGPRLASKNDPRITRTGRIIRNLHVDELPQLLNIVKGDMSLVGPRPERREFIQEYSKTVPEFWERLSVRGGLTGYAQIFGRYNTGPAEKARYDLLYIYNYSLKLDIKLLFLTFRILFQKENAEGVEETKEL